MTTPTMPSLKCGPCTACYQGNAVIAMAPTDNPDDYKGHYVFAPVPASKIDGMQQTGALLFSIETLEALNMSQEFLQAVRLASGFAIVQLQHRENGDCVYLGKDGCTIYERRPTTCRKFDCRLMFLKQTRNERREWIKSGMMPREVYAAARERLHNF